MPCLPHDAELSALVAATAALAVGAAAPEGGGENPRSQGVQGLEGCLGPAFKSYPTGKIVLIPPRLLPVNFLKVFSSPQQLPWWFLGTPQDLEEVSKPPKTPEQNRTAPPSPSRVFLALRNHVAWEQGSARGGVGGSSLLSFCRQALRGRRRESCTSVGNGTAGSARRHWRPRRPQQV